MEVLLEDECRADYSSFKAPLWDYTMFWSLFIKLCDWNSFFANYIGPYILGAACEERQEGLMHFLHCAFLAMLHHFVASLPLNIQAKDSSDHLRPVRHAQGFVTNRFQFTLSVWLQVNVCMWTFFFSVTFYIRSITKSNQRIIIAAAHSWLNAGSRSCHRDSRPPIGWAGSRCSDGVWWWWCLCSNTGWQAGIPQVFCSPASRNDGKRNTSMAHE